MRYVCLIYENGNLQDTQPDTAQAVYGEYYKLAEDARKQGVMRESADLSDLNSATTVRVRDGKRLLTDGPFAETKEVLTGFFSFECNSLDEALDWAARIPSARWGSIEVRPVIEH